MKLSILASLLCYTTVLAISSTGKNSFAFSPSGYSILSNTNNNNKLDLASRIQYILSKESSTYIRTPETFIPSLINEESNTNKFKRSLQNEKLSFSTSSLPQQFHYNGKDIHGGHISFQSTAKLNNNIISLDDNMINIQSIHCDQSSMLISLTTTDESLSSPWSTWSIGNILVGDSHWGCLHYSLPDQSNKILPLPFYRRIKSLPIIVPVPSTMETTPSSLSTVIIQVETEDVPVTDVFSKLHLDIKRSAPSHAIPTHPETMDSSTSSNSNGRKLGVAGWGTHPWTTSADSSAPETIRMNDAGTDVVGMTWNLVNNSATVLANNVINFYNLAGHTLVCNGCYSWSYVDFSVTMASDANALEYAEIKTTVYTSTNLVMDTIIRDTGNGTVPPYVDTVVTRTFNTTTNQTDVTVTNYTLVNPVPNTQFYIPILPDKVVSVLVFNILSIPFAIPVSTRLDLGITANYNATVGNNRTAVLTNVGLSIGGSAVVGTTYDRTTGWRPLRQRAFTITPTVPNFDLPASVSLKLTPAIAVHAHLFSGMEANTLILPYVNINTRAGTTDNACSGSNNTRIVAEVRNGATSTLFLTAPSANILFPEQCTYYGCSGMTLASTPLVPITGTLGLMSTLPRTIGPIALVGETTLASNTATGCVANRNAIVSDTTLAAIISGNRIYLDSVTSFIWNTSLICSQPNLCEYELGPWDSQCSADCGKRSTRARATYCRAKFNGTTVLFPFEACSVSPTAGTVPSRTQDCQVSSCGSLRVYLNNPICNDTAAAILNTVFTMPLRPGCMYVPQLGAYFKDLTCAVGGGSIQGEGCSDPNCDSCISANINSLSVCTGWVPGINVFGFCSADSSENQFNEPLLIESGRTESVYLAYPYSAGPLFFRYYTLLVPLGTDNNAITITIQYTVDPDSNFKTPDTALVSVVSYTDSRCIDPAAPCAATVLSKTDEVINTIVSPAQTVGQQRMRTITVAAGAQLASPQLGGVRQTPRVYLAVRCGSPTPGGCTITSTVHVRTTYTSTPTTFVTFTQPQETAYVHYRSSPDAIGMGALIVTGSSTAQAYALIKPASYNMPNGMIWPRPSSYVDPYGHPIVYSTEVVGDPNLLFPNNGRNYSLNVNGLSIMNPDGGFNNIPMNGNSREFLLSLTAGGRTSFQGTWGITVFDFYKLSIGSELSSTVSLNGRNAYIISVPSEANSLLVSVQLFTGGVTVCIGPGNGAQYDMRLCNNNTMNYLQSTYVTVQTSIAHVWWGPSLTVFVFGDSESRYTISANTYMAMDNVGHVHSALTPNSKATFVGPVSDIFPTVTRSNLPIYDASNVPGVSWAAQVDVPLGSPSSLTLMGSASNLDEYSYPKGTPAHLTFPNTNAARIANDVMPGTSAWIENTYNVPNQVQPVILGVASSAHSVLVTDSNIYTQGTPIGAPSVGNAGTNRLLQTTSDPAAPRPASLYPGVADLPGGGYVDPRNDNPRLFMWDNGNYGWSEAYVLGSTCGETWMNSAVFSSIASSYDYPYTSVVCGQFPVEKFLKPATAPTTSSSDIVLMLQLPSNWRARVAAVPVFFSSNASQPVDVSGLVPQFLTCSDNGIESDSCSPVLSTGSTVELTNCGANTRGIRFSVRPLTSLTLTGITGYFTVAIYHSSAANYGCNAVAPSKTYSWKISAWSACSVVCGYGTRTREVSCIDSATGLAVADVTLCPGTPPSTTKQCVPGTCVVVAQPWSTCSLPCGGGQQVRTVKCINGNGNGTEVDPAKCNPDAVMTPALPLTQSCNNNLCVDKQYYYVIGDWTTCSATCDGGYQTRTIACQQYLTATGNLLSMDLSFCELKVGTRPISKRLCNTRSCARTDFSVKFAEIRRLPYNVEGWFNASDLVNDVAGYSVDAIPNNGIRLYEIPVPSRVPVNPYPFPLDGTNLTNYFISLMNPLPPQWPAAHSGVCVDIRVQVTSPVCGATDLEAMGGCMLELNGCLASVPMNNTRLLSTNLLAPGYPLTRMPYGDPYATCSCYSVAHKCIAARKCTPPANGFGDMGDIPLLIQNSCLTSACGYFLNGTDINTVNASCSASKLPSVYSDMPTVLDVFAIPRVSGVPGSGISKVPLHGRPVLANGLIAVGRGSINTNRTSISLSMNDIPSTATSVLLGVRASGPGVNITLRTNYTMESSVRVSGPLGVGMLVNYTLPPLVFSDKRFIGKNYVFGGRWQMIGINSVKASDLAAGLLNITITLNCDVFVDPNTPAALNARAQQFNAAPSEVSVPPSALFGGFVATAANNVGNGEKSLVPAGWELIAKPYLLSQSTNYTLLSGITFSSDNTSMTITVPALPPSYSPEFDEVLTYIIPGAFLASGRDTPTYTKVRVNTSIADRDCVVGSWSAWSGCQVGAQCSDGIQTRYRPIIQNVIGNGLACPIIKETRPCDACDPCASVSCYNQGLCVEGKCICPPGFGGVDCSLPPPFISLCTVSTGSWGSCGLSMPYFGRAGGETLRMISCNCANATVYNYTAINGASPYPSPSSSQTPTSSPSNTGSISASPSISITPTNSPWQCEVINGTSNCTSASPNASSTSTGSPSNTPSVSNTASITPSVSVTASGTPTPTPSFTPTRSFNWTGNYSVQPNATSSPTPTPSVTPIFAPNTCGYASMLPHITSCPLSPNGGSWRNITAIQVSIPLVGVNATILRTHGNIWDVYGEAFTRQLRAAMAVPSHVLRPISFDSCKAPAVAVTPNTGCITVEILDDNSLATQANGLTAVATLYRLAAVIGAATDISRAAGLVPKPVHTVPRSSSTALIYKPFLNLPGGIASCSWKVVSAQDPLNPPAVVPPLYPWLMPPVAGTLVQLPGLAPLSPPGAAAAPIDPNIAEIATLKGSTVAFVILFFLVAAVLCFIIRRRGLSSRAPRPGKNKALSKYEVVNPIGSPGSVRNLPTSVRNLNYNPTTNGGVNPNFTNIFNAINAMNASTEGSTNNALNVRTFSPTPVSSV